MARTILGLSLALLVVACSRPPRVTYEYEPTQTITSSDPAPASAPAAAPSTSTTLPPPRGWEGRKDW